MGLDGLQSTFLMQSHVQVHAQACAVCAMKLVMHQHKEVITLSDGDEAGLPAGQQEDPMCQ
jgi:tryptophanyl-tRNA synthetase